MFSKKSVKFIIGFVVIVLIVWVAFDGVPRYQNWQKWKNIKKQADEFEKTEKERKELIANDTYGGKTPQETLEMFIKAVEAGDYELASRYFVVEKQEEWKENLINIKDAKKFNTFLDPLKETKKYKGSYSNDKKIFVVHEPILVEYVLYPSNLWKINEI